jgi:hypothetical protein
MTTNQARDEFNRFSNGAGLGPQLNKRMEEFENESDESSSELP